MPILSSDIQLLAAERLLDTADGGGRMTGRIVVDGQSNNLFPDISELDRTYGRVSLRKAYLGILSDGADSYFGTHVIIAAAPRDDRVALSLFTTRSWTDRRESARDRVERYLARGIKWPGQLLERQLAGQRAIALLLKPADPVPRVGQALVLVQDEAKPTEAEQYVRITRVSTVEREFSVSEGSTTVRFTGVIATCEISDPLRQDFEGPPPAQRDDIATRAIVRDTLVANAATYYGIQPTLADAGIGDFTIRVASLWSQLVPAAQAETPLVDLNAAGQCTPLIDSGVQLLTLNYSQRLGPNSSLYLGSGVLPGSLTIALTGTEIRDQSGQLDLAGSKVGTVDYGRGLLRFGDGCPELSGTKRLTWRPAASPIRVADTAAIRVMPETRGYNYTLTLVPPPQPGSVLVSYLAQGQWIDLRDIGTAAGRTGGGILRGADPAYGAGTIDFVTGTVTLTTGALPDANSDILFAWGTAASAFNRADSPVEAPSVRLSTRQGGVVPGSLTITWVDGQQVRTATDDGHGRLSGDATGTVRYASGEIVLRPTLLPAGGAEYSVSYHAGPPQEVSFAHPLRDALGNLAVQLPHPDLRPGSVEIEWNLVIENYDLISAVPAEMQMLPQLDPIKIAHDVPGPAQSAAGTGATGSGTGATGSFDGGVSGLINYSAGTLTFRPDVVISIPKPRYLVTVIGTHFSGTETVTEAGVTREVTQTAPVYRNVFSHWEYVPASATLPLDESAWLKVRYRAADTPDQITETIQGAELVADLTDRFAERIVPGSVRFQLGNQTYIDRLGSLYTDLDPATGAGTLAGTLDYASGRIVLKVWTPGQPNHGALESLLTELAGTAAGRTGQPVDEVCFRIPAAPVRPGSVQVRATPLTGGTIRATADTSGRFDTAEMQGTVDVLTGVVRIRFGRWVTAAGQESQIWFDPAAVANGRIFKPLPVLADTIRFNAVAYRYLPLSADILGLDPVRLPVDGRVPIYRPGDVAVIHHTARTPLPNGQSAGTFNLGRERLSRLRVVDADGKLFPENRYVADLDHGTLTFTTTPDVSGFQ